jgi:hypothetical protein
LAEMPGSRRRTNLKSMFTPTRTYFQRFLAGRF